MFTFFNLIKIHEKTMLLPTSKLVGSKFLTPVKTYPKFQIQQHKHSAALVSSTCQDPPYGDGLVGSMRVVR